MNAAPSTVELTRLRVRPQLHVAPVAGGVYVASSSQQFVLRGWDGFYGLADRCLPLLEEGTTEGDLVLALGSEWARPAVQRLLSSLADHHMLLLPERSSVPEPLPAERLRFAGSLAYLESCSDEPYAAFERWRAAQVVLVGPPEGVEPAGRGLRRAGAGRVLLVRSVAEIPPDVTAALCFVTTSDLASPTLLTPDVRCLEQLVDRGVEVLPVLVDPAVVVVGPLLSDNLDLDSWRRAAARAVSWAGTEVPGPPPSQLAIALAGAHASQLLLDSLAGLAGDGAAHVVHGPDLASQRIVVAGGSDEPRCRDLGTALATDPPGPESGLASAQGITRPWTGLFALAAGDDLPQLPLALREIRLGGPARASAVGWAANQRAATVAAVLAGMRRCAAGAGVGAAGLTEDRWLLDGALRLLTSRAAPVAFPGLDALLPEARRLRLAWERERPPSWSIVLLQVPGLDWFLSRLQQPDGTLLGQAWAADPARATQDALSTAIARVQTEATTGDGRSVDLLSTSALDDMAVDTSAGLLGQVGALGQGRGVRYTGRSVPLDGIEEAPPWWYGPVSAQPVEVASPSVARHVG